MSRPPSVDQAARKTENATAALAGAQQFEMVKAEINNDTAHPDALYLALARIDTEAGRRAFMRAIQKTVEAANATA